MIGQPKVDVYRCSWNDARGNKFLATPSRLRVNHVALAMSLSCRLIPSITDMTVRIANCSDGPFPDIASFQCSLKHFLTGGYYFDIS
jgi:hypothetical protein